MIPDIPSCMTCMIPDIPSCIIPDIPRAPHSHRPSLNHDSYSQAVEEEEPRPKEIQDPDTVNRPWVEYTPIVEGEGEEAEVERQKLKDAYVTTSMHIDSMVIVDSGKRMCMKRYGYKR